MRALVALLVAAAAMLPAGDVAGGERRADAARLMNELMSGKVPVGGPFTLMDQHGRKTRLADFRGKLVLLYFGFTTCPDICPTDMAIIARTIDSLGADGARLQPVFVTLDPGRDTRERLRGYVASFHPRFVALTGSEAQIRRVATAYKVFFEKVPLPGAGGYTIDHAAFTFLLDREGKYIGLFPPGTPMERMAVGVRDQLRSAGTN